MSIELKEAAQQVLKELGEARKIVRASSSRQLAKDWDRRATDALANLRAAIQQAEAQQPDNASCKSVQKRLEVQQPATGEPVKAERDQLRCAQADAVMPLIGPLLDAWENADREVMSQEPELSKQLKNINSAMEDAQPAMPASVQADSSEHLRVIASLGAALRRLSFAAQTTGGTDGPDAELQSAIGQAEQALSLGGIWQAMSATPEPVAWMASYVDPIGNDRVYVTSHHDLAVENDMHGTPRPLVFGDTHPAPSVPDDVVRDAISTVREHYRGTDWGKAAESICDAIDAAMLAAKDANP